MRTDGIGETVEEEDNGKGRKIFPHRRTEQSHKFDPGICEPLPHTKGTFWRKWGYLEGAMSRVRETTVVGYEMDNIQSDFILRINIKAESEYEEKPAPTEL